MRVTELLLFLKSRMKGAKSVINKTGGHQTSDIGDCSGEVLDEMSLDKDSLLCLSHVVESVLPLGTL